MNQDGLSWELASFNILADVLRTWFVDSNLERNTIAVHSNIYQTTLVLEYCMRFMVHSQHTKIDGNMLAPYFYRRLKNTIKDFLAEQKDWTTFEELQDQIFQLDVCLQAKKIERKYKMKLYTAPPMKTEMKSIFNLKPIFNPRPAFTPVIWMTSLTVFHSSLPAPVQTGQTLMELNSQRRRMSQGEHDQCIIWALCFTCKEYGHVSKESQKKRVRIPGIAIELAQEAQQSWENNNAQEYLQGPLQQLSSSWKLKLN